MWLVPVAIKTELIYGKESNTCIYTFQVREQLPNLKAIVQYKGELSNQYPDVYEVTTI